MDQLERAVLYVLRDATIEVLVAGFLCGPCRGVLSMVSLEFSQFEPIRKVGGWCEMAVSLVVSWETVGGQ
jgi:hypothetical protein